MHGGALWRKRLAVPKVKAGQCTTSILPNAIGEDTGSLEGKLHLGLTYALKYKEIEGCALCFLGDGAINQGAFHESLNLAALWDLPVVYIVENNGYSMGTSQARSSVHPDAGIAARAEGYKMHWAHINGESIFDVREGVSAAMELAKSESKPSLLEIHTYRYQGHRSPMRITRNTAPKRKSRTIGRTTIP